MMYVVYDGRAIGGDTDEAAVLLATPNKKEAIKEAKSYGEFGAVVFEYDTVGSNLENERQVYP